MAGGDQEGEQGRSWALGSSYMSKPNSHFNGTTLALSTWEVPDQKVSRGTVREEIPADEDEGKERREKEAE